jgi:hypothetical protein
MNVLVLDRRWAMSDRAGQGDADGSRVAKSQSDRSKSEFDTVEIARCPVHGLHGEREECFVCGATVEKVRMVPETAIAIVCETLDNANAFAEELVLRLCDAQQVLATCVNEDGDLVSDVGSLLSALDYALRGSEGCVEPDEWQEQRRRALANHGDYLDLGWAA